MTRGELASLISRVTFSVVLLLFAKRSVDRCREMFSLKASIRAGHQEPSTIFSRASGGKETFISYVFAWRDLMIETGRFS